MTEKKTVADVESAFKEATLASTRCSVGKLLDTMDLDIKTVVAAKLADNIHYSNAIIAHVLKNLGFPPVSPESISKHRRGECRCV